MATHSAIKAANINITYYANDSYSYSVQVTDEDGVAVNMSGDTITMTIKKIKTWH